MLRKLWSLVLVLGIIDDRSILEASSYKKPSPLSTTVSVCVWIDVKS
jgi:hypothetical protein